MTWWGAQAWANQLTLGGLAGWTLPTTVPAVGYNQTGSQLGNLFYNQLGGGGTSITTNHNNNYNLFSNVQDFLYWSSTEWAPNTDGAWHFSTYQGYQEVSGKSSELYAWAVHAGDVSTTAVPLPTAYWLFTSGLIGLLSLNRKKKH
ncbi:MAG: hypothetical protein NTY69_06495 [Methylococcales bacterium]|nr:hypothetical protein [Methylococcales bacterium]